MMRSRNRNKNKPAPLIFTSNDVAVYEYCRLQWWYEHYDPLTQADNEDLFNHLVGMEEDYGQQANVLPDYIVAEQILMRRGAFQQAGSSSAWDEIEPSFHSAAMREDEDLDDGHRQRQFLVLAIGTLTLALFILLIAWISLSFP